MSHATDARETVYIGRSAEGEALFTDRETYIQNTADYTTRGSRENFRQLAETPPDYALAPASRPMRTRTRTRTRTRRA